VKVKVKNEGESGYLEIDRWLAQTGAKFTLVANEGITAIYNIIAQFGHEVKLLGSFCIVS